MKLKEIMERASTRETGRSIAYIKDGLEEIAIKSPEYITAGSLTRKTISDLIITSPVATLIKNGDVWVGATDGSFDYDVPDNWIYYSGAGNAGVHKYQDDDGILQIELGDTEGVVGGLYQQVIVDVGLEYTLSYDWKQGTSDYVTVRVGNSAGNNELGSIIHSGTPIDLTTDTISFTPTQSPVFITIGIKGGVEDTAKFDNVKLFVKYSNGNSEIKDANNGLGVFKSGMKLLVNGTQGNDTDESSNAVNGYYTIYAIEGSGGRMAVTDILIDETVSRGVELRGHLDNFANIQKNKRFYSFPPDMVKLLDIKVKNHLNDDGEYRSISRMTYEPNIEDSDGI